MAAQPLFCQAGTLNGDRKVGGKQQPVSPQRTAPVKKSARWRRNNTPMEGRHGVEEHGGLEEEAADPEMEALEKELREYLLYAGQVGFYEDMMKERRNIRAARLRAAQRKAQTRKFYLDCVAILIGALVGAGVIGLTIGVIVG